ALALFFAVPATSATYPLSLHDALPILWLPSVTASGGVGYAGPGEQNFLTSSFSQSVSTWSSSYSFLLEWTLNGQTISQPGLKKRSEEHTSELQSRGHLVCRLLLEKKNK